MTFGNSTEFGQIDRNPQQVILCFFENIVSASSNKNFFYVEHESRLKTQFQNSQIKIYANQEGRLSSISFL